MRIKLRTVSAALTAVTLGIFPSITGQAASVQMQSAREAAGLTPPASATWAQRADAWGPSDTTWQRIPIEDVAYYMNSAPALSSDASNRLDAFWVDASPSNTDIVRHLWWNGSGWSPMEGQLFNGFIEGGAVLSAPAAVSWGPNRIDLFARGYDSYMYHGYSTSSTWHGWTKVGGTQKIWSAPTVASWESGHLDIFAASNTGTIMHMSYIDSTKTWSSWGNVGGTSFRETISPLTFSAPSAVSWGPRRVDLVWRGEDSTPKNNRLMHKAWNGSAWEAEQLIDDPHLVQMLSAPVVSSWASGRLDVFAATDLGGVWHRSYDSGSWSVFWGGIRGSTYQKPTTDSISTEAPAAVSWAPERIDILVRSQEPGSGLWHKWWAVS